MTLAEDDVRRMVRLVGEVVAVPGGHAEKKRFLMEGLCELVQADAWVWALSCQREPDKPQIYVSPVRGGFTDETFVKLLEALEHPDMIRLAAKFYEELKEKNDHLTRSRDQISDPRDIVESPAMELWKAANIGPVLLSQRPLDAASSSTMALYRAFGRPEFSPRDVRIAHIVLTEVPWLHEQGWPEDRGVGVPRLSKRLRFALNLLILGQSRKEIAANMNISVNTAQGYIKDIYRFFQVNSQAELMHKFHQGNGSDLPSPAGQSPPN
jgi:DNA-binding CsgD family transcriptional regulator